MTSEKKDKQGLIVKVALIILMFVCLENAINPNLAQVEGIVQPSLIRRKVRTTGGELI